MLFLVPPLEWMSGLSNVTLQSTAALAPGRWCCSFSHLCGRLGPRSALTTGKWEPAQGDSAGRQGKRGEMGIAGLPLSFLEL